MLLDIFLTDTCLAVSSADALGKDYVPSSPKSAFRLFVMALVQLSSLNFCVGLGKFLFPWKLNNTITCLKESSYDNTTFSCAPVNPEILGSVGAEWIYF